ncbi:hypothetical protein [Sphingomonas sp. PB4P5]|uniref:hypothetical protein n=1 Tax=Parasphingomonas puruogangriensis TaxID=3096155 RepID=UPI002FC606A0
MTDPVAPANGTKNKVQAQPEPPKTTIEKTRLAATHALDTARDSARDAADRTAKAIDANPLPALVGGVVIGALAGALVPRSRREAELLAPVGRKLRATTTDAVQSAKTTGLAELGALGLSKGALSEQGGKLVGGILTALATAGSAAITASREAKAKAEISAE